MYVVADPDLLKLIMIKEFSHFVNRIPVSHFKLYLKGAVHDFMGDFDVLHLVFCLAYMHKIAFID